MDGSPLDPAEITGYRVYADTIPAGPQYFDVPGAVNGTSLSGLIACRLYYLNVRCLDACGHAGDLCPGNQISAFTSSPCNPQPPVAPANLLMTAYDDHLSLEWPANHVDCDLQGYRIYYGATAGVYNGNFAAQGPSPITVLASDVTVGNVCRLDLNGLDICQSCFVIVKATDSCVPTHESAPSPEAGGTTTCTPCLTNSACAAWAVDGGSNNQLHLEVYTTNPGGETITRLTPTFAGTAKVREIWFGRPLAKIWAGDGTAGQDGNVGPRPSGSVLNIDDSLVPSSATHSDGVPLKVVFDSDVRDLGVNLAFRGFSGLCTANGTGRGPALVDDFDDGNYTGWTASGGSWTVSGGELAQPTTSSTFVLKSPAAGSGDQTIEAKIKLNSGGSTHSAHLVLRYQNSTNYYVCGIRSDTDKVIVGKMVSGTLTIPTGGSVNCTINDNVWYLVRAVMTTNHVKIYVNCNLVLDLNTALTWATGGTGLCTQKTSARFDDVKSFAGSVLP